MSDRYNKPSDGTSDWHVPLNENFDDLGVEVTNEVATFSDLPAPDSNATSSNGNPRRYLVRESRIVYRDNGSEWEAVGGLGSEYVVGEGDNLMDKINANGKGYYTLRPRDSDYLIDEQNSNGNYAVPSGVHIRGSMSVQPESGTEVYNPPSPAVIVSPTNPSSNQLYLENFSSIGYCWVKNVRSPGAVSNAGDPRWIGPHWSYKTDNTDLSEPFWGGQRLNIKNAGTGEDEPTVAFGNKGAGDTIWLGGTGEANTILRIRGPDSSNTTNAISWHWGDGTRIGYVNFKGHFYLASAEPRVQMNAPSSYAGNYPAEEKLSTLRLRTGSEPQTDELVINDGFSKKAPSLGVGAGSVDINVSNGESLTVSDPVNGHALFQIEEQDLTASSSPSPSEEGVFAMHEGTDKPKGLYRSDPSNSQWIKVEDNSIFINY